MFKFSTLIFMVTTVVFAGLYFTEKEYKPKTFVETREVVKVVKVKQAMTSYEKEKLSSPELKRESPINRVIIKEISSHPELSKFEIDMMSRTYKEMTKKWSGRSKRSHPLLYEKLSLDEETEKKFLSLIGERRMNLYMSSPDKDASEEEKEEHQAYKEDTLKYVDDKISDLIGEKSDVYFNYRERSLQYSSVSGINRGLKQSGIEMNEQEQDQLAEVMFDNRRELDSDHAKYDWAAARKNPERIDEILDFHKKRYDAMKSQVNFLSEIQQEAFNKHLDDYLNKYKRYAGQISKRR
jgi:hypothetical protein